MKSTSLKKLGLSCLLFLSLVLTASAQDTVRVMSYNLLRYGAQGIACTPMGVTARNSFLISIMGATRPDIFGVNEVGPVDGPTSPASNLLINVLQTINPAYRRSTVTFNGVQDIANCMYYNSDKFGLAFEDVIPTPTLTLRDLNYYKFYYKGPGLALGDTTFLEVVQLHYHSSDEQTRAVQGADIMNYLGGLGRSGNFIVQGDFNLDGSTPQSFQVLVANPNSNIKLNDVKNLTGNWHGNGSAQSVMTQATSSSPAPCGSGGSLDDRFDMILVSNDLLNGTDGIQVLPSTYWVPGNAIAPNAAVTSTVLNSLRVVSDHFPVVMDFEISQAVGMETTRPVLAPLRLNGNPSQGLLHVTLGGTSAFKGACALQLVGLSGQLLKSWDAELSTADQQLELDARDLASGAYFLQLVVGGQRHATAKVLLLRP